MARPEFRDFPGGFERYLPDLCPTTIRDIDWEDMVAPHAEGFLSRVQEYVSDDAGGYEPEEGSPSAVFISMFRKEVEDAIEKAADYAKRTKQEFQKILAASSKRKSGADASSVAAEDQADVLDFLRRLAVLLDASECAGALEWSKQKDSGAIDRILRWLTMRQEGYLTFRLRRELGELTLAALHHDLAINGPRRSEMDACRQLRREALAKASKARATLLHIADLQSTDCSAPSDDASEQCCEARGRWESVAFSDPAGAADQPSLLQLRWHISKLEEGVPFYPPGDNWFLLQMVLAEHASRALVVELNAAHHAELAEQVSREYGAFHAAAMRLDERQSDTEPRQHESNLAAAKKAWESEVSDIVVKVRHRARVLVQTLGMIHAAVPNLVEERPKSSSRRSTKRHGTKSRGRGRPPLKQKEGRRYRDMWAAWEKASGAGTSRKDFCDDWNQMHAGENIDVDDLDNAGRWIRKQDESSNQS